MTEVTMKVQISPMLLIMSAAMILTKDINIRRVAIILSAAVIHELGHLAAARILGISIKKLKLDIFGALLETDTSYCSYKKEAALALAGPLANILSALAIFIIRPDFDCSLFIISSCVFASANLMPAKGFDGGRALSCLLLLIMSPRAVKNVSDVLSFVCIFLLWTVSVYFIMRTGSYLSLFVFSAALFSKLFLSGK